MRSALASPRDSRAGSVESAEGSIPGTPRKRVRYADEESLPLESFKDPSPGYVVPKALMGMLTSSAYVERPRKKPRGLLLPPGEGDVPEANKFTYKARSRVGFDVEEEDAGELDGIPHSSSTSPGGLTSVQDGEEGHDGNDGNEEDEADGEGGTEENGEDQEEEDEDEFAKMVSLTFVPRGSRASPNS